MDNLEINNQLNEVVSEPVVVEDDLDHPGTLLYPTPLPGPHVVVVNAITGNHTVLSVCPFVTMVNSLVFGIKTSTDTT
jgi:hypothetical protein